MPVWPNSQGVPHDICTICVPGSGRFLIYGDFNAQHASWGSAHKTPHGRTFSDVLFSLNLILLKDEFLTYFRPGGVYLTNTSLDVQLL